MFVSSGLKELQAWAHSIGVHLEPESWELLVSFLENVAEQNKKVNLTADAGEDLFLRHAADGLAAVPILRRVRTNPRPPAAPAYPSIIDVGAGAGFVGVAIKLACPETEITLLESSRRKFHFLNQAAVKLGLRGLRVMCAAAPGGLRGKYWDAVLARAVAPLAETLRLAMPLVREKTGILLAYRSAATDTDEPGIGKALEATAARLDFIEPYRLPRESRPRHLVVFRR